jgi:tellurite resistance protein
MVSTTQSPYTNEQIAAWVRGLLSIAWSDGQYDEEEQSLITELTKELVLPDTDGRFLFHSITPEELAAALGKDNKTGENFLRTAVLVAVADGVYSTPEAELLHQFSEALGLKIDALQALDQTLCKPVEIPAPTPGTQPISTLVSPPVPHPDILQPLKDWMDGMEIHDPRLARFICKMVPPQCPFERDIQLFGRKIVHIPPLCKLNPLYEQLVGLRFRSLSYLADDCKEDISAYI